MYIVLGVHYVHQVQRRALLLKKRSEGFSPMALTLATLLLYGKRSHSLGKRVSEVSNLLRGYLIAHFWGVAKALPPCNKSKNVTTLVRAKASLYYEQIKGARA